MKTLLQREIFAILTLSILIGNQSMAQNYIPTSTWEGPIPPAVQDEPAYYKDVVDSVFNTRFKKVTDDALPTLDKVFGGSDRTYYSLRPVFNENSTMYLLNSGKIFHVKNNNIVGHLWYMVGNTSFKNPMWSKVNPNILYGTKGLKLMALNVVDLSLTLIRDMGAEDDFATKDGKIYMDNKQSISGNDSLVVLSDIPHGGRKIVVVNIQTGERHAMIEDAVAYSLEHGFTLRDFVSDEPRMNIGVSPSSKYIVLGGNTEQLLDDKLNWIRPMQNHGHADFAIDTDGNDVYVSICPAKYEILSTGETFDLLGANTFACGHLNGSANYKQPGWAYLSIDEDLSDVGKNGNRQGYEIVAVKLDKEGTTVRRVIHPRNTGHGNNNEEPAYGVPNPDGTLLIYNSKWSDPGAETNAYLVKITAPYTLSTTTRGNGNVTSKGNGAYDEGDTVLISAFADFGDAFLRWEGDYEGTENPLIIRIDSNTNLVAVFTPDNISTNAEEVVLDPTKIIVSPNPFTSSLSIDYTLTKKTQLNISVSDIFGRNIVNLEQRTHLSGAHTVEWRNNNIPSGIYLIHFKSPTLNTVVRVMKIK